MPHPDAFRFKPPLGLRNRHTQSILASSKLRLPLLQRRAREMYQRSREQVLDVGDGVRLHAVFSEHETPAEALVILIHGWEGSHNSVYLQSAAGTLYSEGLDVVRLNLRDHGPSHHLNEGLFHAACLDEVVRAVAHIRAASHYRRYALVGFSLGGNFALRVALKASQGAFELDQVVAVCPVFDPVSSFQAMQSGPKIYRRYFLKKWKRSLTLKRSFFPDLINAQQIEEFKSLMEITEQLVQLHTPFGSVDEYFESYRLTPSLFDSMDVTTDIFIARDDPVVPPVIDEREFKSSAVRLHSYDTGGHCGFIKNYRLHSFIDDALVRLLAGKRLSEPFENGQPAPNA